MMLTAAQIEARAGKLTASRVAALMKGDAEAILRLYREMIGEEPEEDLSDVWFVQLGSCTEQLQMDWYEAKGGGWVVRRGNVVTHPMHDWAACTLDGWIYDLSCPIECKHVGGREPLEVIIERYQPQMQWQMECTGSMQCALSVIMGANEPIVEFVPRDPDYAAELMRRGAQFMDFVRRRVPPFVLPPAPPPIDASKVYDFTSNNSWAFSATDWLLNKDAAVCAENASKALKAMVPADAKKCSGHGVRITRNRAGHLSLRVDA
jgi:predicted phage-related endonuclease